MPIELLAINSQWTLLIFAGFRLIYSCFVNFLIARLTRDVRCRGSSTSLRVSDSFTIRHAQFFIRSLTSYPVKRNPYPYDMVWSNINQGAFCPREQLVPWVSDFYELTQRKQYHRSFSSNKRPIAVRQILIVWHIVFSWCCWRSYSHLTDVRHILW